MPTACVGQTMYFRYSVPAVCMQITKYEYMLRLEVSPSSHFIFWDVVHSVPRILKLLHVSSNNFRQAPSNRDENRIYTLTATQVATVVETLSRNGNTQTKLANPSFETWRSQARFEVLTIIRWLVSYEVRSRVVWYNLFNASEEPLASHFGGRKDCGS